MANMVSATRVKVLCLAALVVLTGVNGEVWGQNTSYSSRGDSGVELNWADKDNWTNGSSYPGELVFKNGSTYDGNGLVTISHKITLNPIDAAILALRTSGVFDIQKLTLNNGADLTLYESLYVNGSNKQNDSYTYNGGNLTVQDGATFTVNKKFILKANQTINGNGWVVINRVMKADGGGEAGRTLTADVNLKITTQNDIPENTNFTTEGDFSLVIKKRADFIRQSKNSTTAFKGITIDDTDASFHINANGRTVSCQTLTINGGMLEIASGSTCTVSDGAGVLTVNNDAVLKGTGTLNVSEIYIVSTATLTIDGSRTFDGVKFTGGGKLKIADGTTLTLKGTTFKDNNNITILAGEEDADDDDELYTGKVDIVNSLTSDTEGSTLSTEVSTELKSTGTFTNFNIIDIKGGTFTNNWISEIEKIKVANGAKLSTIELDVTSEAELLGRLENGEINVTGNKITFGSGTGFGLGTNVTINSESGTATIDGLGNCYPGHIILTDDQAITYNNSTCILPATYTSLTFNGTEATLCGVAEVSGSFALSQNITISGDNNLTLNGPITGDKNITISGASVDIASGGGAVGVGAITVKDGGSLSYDRPVSLTNLNVDGTSTIEFGETAGTLTLTNPTLGGNVSVADGIALTLTGNVTFGENTNVDYNSGSGVVKISNNAVIDSLRSCDLGLSFVDAKPTITYTENSTCIIGGTYTALTIQGSTVTLCDVVTVEGAFALTKDISLTSDSKSLTLGGAVTGSKIITATSTAITVSDSEGAFAGGFVMNSGSELTIDRECTLNTLAVDGGSAALNAATTVTEITVSGGSVSINAETSVAEDFTFAAGTLAVNAATTIGGDGTLNGTTTFGNNGTITIAGNATLNATINLTGANASLTVGGSGKTITFGSNTSISDGSKLIIGDGSTIDGLKNCITGVDLDSKNIIYGPQAEVILPADYATLQTNSNVTLCGGNVSVAGAFTWNSGNVTLNGYNLTLNGALGGNTTYNKDHTIMVCHNGGSNGQLIRSGFDALTNFQFPIGTTKGNTRQFAMVTITGGFTKEIDANPASISITTTNAIDLTVGSALNLKRSWDIETGNISELTNVGIVFKYDETDSETNDFDALAKDGAVVENESPVSIVFDRVDEEIIVEGLTEIEGHWTAIDKGLMLYSTGNGNWNTKSTWINEQGENDFPNETYNVIISEGHTVTMAEGTFTAKRVGIYGTLNKAGKSFSGVRYVFGEGVLQVDGTFAGADADYTEFLSETGGTVELMGDFSGQSSFNFNNLILNNTDGEVSSLDPSGANILGDLIIRGGDMEFDGDGAITIGDSIRVESGQTLTFSSTPEVTVSAIDAKVGNVAINGNVTITDSVDLAGTNFTVNTDKSLILSNGTKHTTNATVGGAGNVELADGKDLKGTLSVSNLKLNSTATISGEVTAENIKFDDNVAVSGNGKLTVSGSFSEHGFNTSVKNFVLNGTGTPEATITVVSDTMTVNRKTTKDYKFNNLTINDGGVVLLQGENTWLNNLTMSSGATLAAKKDGTIQDSKLSGSVTTSKTFTLRSSVDFSGIDTLGGKYEVTTNLNVTNLNPSECLTGYTFNGGNYTIDYKDNCSYIFTGTYTNIKIRREAGVTLCGEVTIKGEFSPTMSDASIGTFNINGNGYNLIVEGNVTGGHRLVFNNVNTTFGKADTKMTITASELNLNNGSTLTIAGKDSVITKDITFNGDGEIAINSGAIFDFTSRALTFVNDQTISGEGTLRIGKAITATGKVLTTTANVDIKITDGTNRVSEYKVKGGTFTNDCDKDIAKLTVFKNATLKAASNTSISTLTVADGGTIVIADNKTLTASTGSLNISGAATITSEGSSSISAANVELASNSKLTINKTIKLNNPLQIKHGNDTIVGGTDAVLDWTGGSENYKVTVVTGKLLALGGTLTINKNVTLAGAIVPMEHSVLNLGGSEVTFTAASNFGDAAGKICFTRAEGVTIKSLQSDPKVASSHVEYAGTVTYDVACTGMLPGVYPALTLNIAESKNISMFDSVTVNGTLTWTNGRIALNNKVLTISEVYASADAFSADKMVVAGGNGTLIYKEKSGSTRTIAFPVGTFTYTNMGDIVYRYSPVTVSGVNTVVGDTIKVSVEGESFSGSSSDLNRYWTIKARTNMGGNLTLQYDAADDIKGYGASDGSYWRVFVTDSVFDENDPHSPFANNRISLSTTAINGIWTAVEYPVLTTLYSFKTGPWDDVNTWTTISDGSKWVNPGLKPSRTDYFDIVILGSDSVFVRTDDNYLHARSITLKGQDTKLTVINGCDVDVNNLLGKGTFILNDLGEFPDIEHTEDFMSPDGGTTMFSGEPDGDSYDLSQSQFNNLVIKYTKDNVKLNLPNSIRRLVINGRLELDNGALVYTADNQAIHVNGDINIDREGKILNTVAGGASNQIDTLQVRGSLYNHGIIKLTNRVWNDYKDEVKNEPKEAKQSEGKKGRGIIRFVGETNNRFECYNTTNFSQLIIDKGVDPTYRLTVYSEGEQSFGLLGCATNNKVALPGFKDGDPFPSDPEVYYKPLWIKCGTLELTGDVHIRSLAESDGSKQFDCAYIPASGCLHLNGPAVKVDATMTPSPAAWTSIIPAGRLIVEAGEFDGKGSSGITFVGTSYVEVKDRGIMKLAQFRPSNFAANGTATFKLSGDGLVEINGDGDVNLSYPAFSMPDVSYIFEMTGGTLRVTTAIKNDKGVIIGAFVVKSNPRNGKIEGGIIEINTGAARKGASDFSAAEYIIASEIPLYNLVLKNENVDGTTNTYVKHIIKDVNAQNGKNVTVPVTASTVIKNNLVIEGNVIFDTNGKKITVGGNLEVKSGGKVYAYKADCENEFVMNGEGTIKIDGSIEKTSTDGTSGFYHLTIAEGAHIKMKNDIDVRGKFTLAEGAIMEDDGENHVYTLHGDAEFDGTYKREPTGAGKIVFKGENILSKGNGKVNNLEINAGTEVLLKHPTNAGTQTKLTVTGKLDFATDTKFNIGINNLTLDEQATVVATGGEFGKDRMIVTLGSGSLGVTKVYSESHPSFFFPFGFNSGTDYYTPASIGYSAADAWGSVTSRPVSGYAFRTTESLNCYWINSETGFDNTGTMTFNGYWYSDALTPSGNTGYEAGRRNGGDWECYGTASVNTAGRAGCPEERYMQISDDISATGYYSCGKSDAFLAGVQLFTSKYAEGDTVVDWKDWTSWSRELGGEPVGDGYVPNENTAVQIGGVGKNHKVVITEGSKKSASLNIAPGSSLDLGTTTGHNFQIIEVDEAVGAGTLMLASNGFPSGDFAKFNGAHGGTVKYYIEGSGTTYTLSTSPANYCNLIVGGNDESHLIIMPNCDMAIYRNFIVDGWVRTCSNNDDKRTVTIDSNMIVANGRFLMWENGKVQTYKVIGDVVVADGAKLIADVSSTVKTANILEIHGDLDVNGEFNATNGKGVFNTVFKGATDSKITNTTNVNIKFNTLECNKDNVSAKLVLTTNKIQSATENQAHPNGYLMTFTRGTLEVDFENQDDVIYLTRKADFDVPGEGCLSVVSGKVVVADDTDATCLDLYGQIVIEDKGKLYVGAIDGGGSKYNSILYAPEGRPTITINGGLLTVLGQISRQKDQIMGSLVWEQSGGDVVIKGHNRSGGPGWLVERAAFEIKNSGSFTMSGGTITTKAGGGVDACGDIYIIPATANCTGGTIIVGGGDQKLHTTVALNHLKVNTGSSLAVYNRDIVLDSLTIEGSGVFNAQNHKITIRKAFANHNNNSEDLVNRISSGYVTGSSTQVTRFENDVTLECVGDFSTQFGMLEIDGDLTLKSGCSKIRVASDLTQYSGTVTDNGNTISLFGDLWYEGVFDGVGGIDFCNKDVIQHIRGSENETRSLGTIIISNPNEVFLNTQLHITKNIYLGASLYTDHNSITLDQNASILPKPGTDGFSSTRMIRLNGEHGDFGITKYVQTGPSEFTLPIGIVDNGERHYTPAEYLFRSNSFSGAYITIKPINFLHKNLSLTPSHKLNYYWHVVADGFDEATEDVKTDCGFNVKQTYTFTDSKVDGDVEKAMLPEFLYSNGVDLIWAELGTHAEISDNQIIFDNIGHLSGDYTAGVIGTDGIYTGLKVLYSKQNGDWKTNTTWEYLTDEEGADPADDDSWIQPDEAPDGNPIHIRPGDTITVTRTVEAYSLCFDDTLKNGTQDKRLGMLDIGISKGSDFGPVTGAGWLRMEPDGEYHQYKMPAGNFDLFLRDSRTVVEFSGANGFLPNAIIGHVSLPLQNVVLSGTNVKTLTKEDGEYINGYMEIRNGTQLKFNNTPIYIKGDWIDLNKATSGFDGGTSDTKSVVELNGTSRKQNISLANDQSSFWKLKINNSNNVILVKNAAAEVGTVKMGIGKQLILGNGHLKTYNTVYPVMASAATITGASATSYVDGPLARIMDANSSFTFPVGNAGEYAPMAVLAAQPAAVDDEWLVTYHNSTIYGGIEYTCDPTITEACRTEFWTVVAPGDATAKLKLRANTHTFGALGNANLKRVKIVGLDNSTTVWHVIESSHVTGTTLPLAMVVTDEAINLNDYRAFSLGYAGPSANLLVSKESSNATFYICDGEGGDYDGDGADDKVEVPIYFTGIGGPYVVTYSVSLEGVGSKEFVKSVTVNGDNVGTLTFTGYELGEAFGRAVGFNEKPYQVKLVGVTEDGDNCPILNETNTASIYVMYNAVPEITGATIVGMRDTRLYSADNSGTLVDVNPYTWEIDGSYKGKLSYEGGTTKYSREPKFNFGENIVAGVPTPYDVTLRVTKVYKTISGESTCTRYAEKTVSVKIKPQPQIHSVTTDDVFAACTGAEYRYETEKISGHEYTWKASNGTVTASLENTCTITWASDPGQVIVLDSVSYKVSDEPEVWEKIGGADTVGIQVNEGISLGAGENTLADNTYVCDNTYGSIVIGNTNSSYSYTLYNASDDTPLSKTFTSSTGELTIRTNSLMQYEADNGPISFYVVVRNIGCSDRITGKKIKMLKKPVLATIPPVVSSTDLYIGNLALIDGAVKDGDGIADIASYSFVYSGDGVTYDDEKYAGEKPEDWEKDFDDKATNNILKVKVPFADKLKGTLNVYSTATDGFKCSSSYDIDAGTISQDYLWRGKTDDWNNANNWWAGIPDGNKNVVIRSGKYISDGIGAADGDDMGVPTLSGNYSVNDITIESRASVSVDEGKTLTINGDVDCAGEFIGNGTVAFSNDEHTVSGTSPKFTNLTNSGTVTVASDITVTGTINNTGSFTGDAKDVILSGGSVVINGTGEFENVTVKAGAGNDVTVNGSPTINGKMTLNSGHVKVADGQQISFSAEGEMDKTGDSWIVGKVGKTWGANTDNLSFYIGSPEHIAQVDIKPESSGATFTASYRFNNAEHVLAETENLTGDLTRVSGMERWDIHNDNNVGSLITLYFDDYSEVTDASKLVVAHKNNAGKWEELTEGHNYTSSSVSGRTTSYSDFTLGTKEASVVINPLPVTFVAFTGRQVGNSVVLDWATLSEKDNDYFEIERSLDGVNFVTIGYVGGAGDSDRRIDYTFSDNAPEQGWLYYRLSQVDFDGTRVYADKVVSVLYAGNETEQLTIVPNPTDGRFRVSAAGSMAGGVVQLLSQTGSVVRTINVDGFDAVLDISDLPNGIYLLRFVADTKILQQKVVKY